MFTIPSTLTMFTTHFLTETSQLSEGCYYYLLIVQLRKLSTSKVCSLLTITQQVKNSWI